MKKVAWKKITAFEGPEESPGFLLWQVSTEWRRSIESALRTVELTHPQFVLLASLGWLTRSGKNISQVELARHCRTDIAMTSQVLRALEKRGFILRNKIAGNERSKFLSITPQGALLIEKALPLVEGVDRQFFSSLGPDTLVCVDILKQLTLSKKPDVLLEPVHKLSQLDL